MPTDKLDVHWPLGGESSRYGFQNSPEHIYTCAASLNTRNPDVFQHRLRGGSRPGLAQILPPKATDEPVIIVPNTIEIVPTKDVTIGRHDTGFIADNNIYDFGIPKGNNLNNCGVQAANAVGRAFMHFDLTNVPTGAAITTATLINRAFAAPNGSASVGILMWARRVTQTGWLEAYRASYPTGPYGKTTWTRYDVDSSLSWATPGGDYDTADQAQWALGPYPSGDFTITGLAALANDAMTLRGKQLHLILMRQDEGTAGARSPGYQWMNGREWGISFPTAGPRLSVTYE